MSKTAVDSVPAAPSKLQIFCTALMEAAWLTAVVLSPLLLNPHAAILGEPEKAYAMRSLALLAGGAWLLVRFESYGSGHRGSRKQGTLSNSLRNPIWKAVAVLAVVNILSTLMSIAPHLSWWGSYERMQGLYTTLGYMVLFGVAADKLRSPAQYRRLQFALILTSVPVALYAIVQSFGLDPIAWETTFFGRSASTLGNPIFLGAYLIMVIPITSERMLCVARSWFSNRNGQLTYTLHWAALCLILAIQIVAVLLSKSRGPFLGLFVSIAVFILITLRSLDGCGRVTAAALIRGITAGIAAIVILCSGMFALPYLPRIAGIVAVCVCLLLFSILYLAPILKRRGSSWLWIGWLTQLAGFAAILLFVNMHGWTQEAFRDLPYLGRLTQITDASAGSVRVRELIWQGSINAFWAHPPLMDYSGRSDSVAPIRPILGHGPESLRAAFRRFYPAELATVEARTAETDRAHNEVMDQLVTSGAIGLVAFLALFTVAAHFSMRKADLITCRKDSLVFFAACIVMPLAGAIIPLALRHGYYVGPGIGLGMASAIVSYVLYRALCPREMKIGPHGIAVLAIFAGILGHFIELQFGVATIATRMLFFLYLAVLVALGRSNLVNTEGVSARNPTKSGQLRESDLSGRTRSKNRPNFGAVSRYLEYPILSYAAIGAVASVIIAWDFVLVRQAQSGFWGVLWNSYFTVLRDRQYAAAAGAIWIVLLTPALGLLLALGYSAAGSPKNPGKILREAGVFLTVTLSACILYSMVKARRIIAAFGFSSSEDAAEYIASHVVSLFVWLSMLVIGICVVLWRSELSAAAPAFRRRMSLFFGIALITCIPIAAYETNLRPSRASVLMQLAENAENRNRQHSLELYRRAVELDPGRDQYHFHLGSALIRALPSAEDVATRTHLLAEAEKSLNRALELDPWNSNYCLELGRLQAARARYFTAEEERRIAIRQAISWHEKAAALSPNTGIIYMEMGSIYFQLRNFDMARKQFEQSIFLDPKNAETYVRLGGLELQSGNLKEALGAYDHAIQINRRNSEALGGRGFVLANLGQQPEAIQAYQEALAVNPHDSAALKNLALLYNRSGDLWSALRYAQMALQELPQRERPDYERFIESLQKRLAEQNR